MNPSDSQPRATRPPAAWQGLISELEKLPGFGRRSAERIAFHLLRHPPEASLALAHALERFVHGMMVCSQCGHITESDPCSICSDTYRDHSQLLVVERPTDVLLLEQTGLYRGLYHVLMGRLSPMEQTNPNDLNIESLQQRSQQPEIKELILGTSPTVEGDCTASWLSEHLKRDGLRISRLARGLPNGTSLQDVSKSVLMHALQARTPS